MLHCPSDCEGGGPMAVKGVSEGRREGGTLVWPQGKRDHYLGPPTLKSPVGGAAAGLAPPLGKELGLWSWPGSPPLSVPP